MRTPAIVRYGWALVLLWRRSSRTVAGQPFSELANSVTESVETASRSAAHALPLRLNEELLIGRGTLRACYLHPKDENLIIKVALPGRKGGADANLKELKSYRQMCGRHGHIDHISHIHGFVATDRGEGLVCDCIRDSSGEIARTIWDIVVNQDTCDIDHIVEVARTLCDYLIAHDLFLFDINLKNIVLRRARDDSYRAYAVDLKGPYDNKEFLQLSSRITFLGRRKLKRRSQQLLERIVQFREQRHELKNLAG